MEDATIQVDDAIVACDGGAGAAGHPRVFLDIENRGEVFCPYCSRHYILKLKG